MRQPVHPDAGPSSGPGGHAADQGGVWLGGEWSGGAEQLPVTEQPVLEPPLTVQATEQSAVPTPVVASTALPVSQPPAVPETASAPKVAARTPEAAGRAAAALATAAQTPIVRAAAAQAAATAAAAAGDAAVAPGGATRTSHPSVTAQPAGPVSVDHVSGSPAPDGPGGQVPGGQVPGAPDGPGGSTPGGRSPGGPGGRFPGGPPPEAPGARRPGRDPLWARLLVAVGALLVVVSTGAIAVSWVVAGQVDASVNKDQLLAPNARGAQGGAVVGPLNFLLIGSDARKDSPDDGQRSDTMIIVHVPQSMDRAYLISVPRDLRVAIPPFEETGFEGSTEKINSAFDYGGAGSGGVQLLSATLTELAGIRFDGAAVIDFDGFKQAVKLLGGVEMCLDQRVESQHIGFDKDGNYLAPWTGPEGTIRVPESTPVVYEPGCRRFKDWEALDVARQRKSLPGGDFDRQKNQQKLIRAILDEARRQGIATNPAKATELMKTIGSSLTVDTNGVRVADLILGLSDVRPDSVIGIRLPSYPETIGGISYVVQDEETAEGLYEAIRDDSLDSWAAAHSEWVNPL